MVISATSPEEYISQLPDDRKEIVKEVREFILQNLPEGYNEGIQYGMISYCVPLSIYPKGYLDNPEVPVCYISLASQKNHLSLYLFGVYTNEKEYMKFVEEYKATGKKLDMGKSCVRFKKIEDLPLDLIAKTIAGVKPFELVKMYEEARQNYKRSKK